MFPVVDNKTNQGCLRNEIGDSLARLNYNLTLYSSYFIFLNFTESASFLSQNILQRKVGEDAGALAQHADELLRRVLHVRILQDVDAAIHLVVGSI